MEFTVKRFDLLQELTLIQGIVERKTTIPILANVLVQAEEGQLRILATDLEVGLNSTCPSSVTAAGVVTLPAKRLYEIVRALPDKEIRFKQGNSNWTMVTCGSSRFRIAGLPKEDFPSLPEGKSEGIKIPAAVMSQLINRTIYAISTEDSKYTFSGALMVIKPGSVVMVATDGHRLSHVEKRDAIENISTETKILIPKKAMSELLRMFDEDEEGGMITFSRDDNHLFFDLGGRLLVARVLSGQFPNWEAVIPRSNDRSFVIDREDIAAAVRRVAILADERSKTIRFGVASGSLEITATHSELGEANESLEIEYDREEFQIGFNYQYLIDFLSTVPEAQVSFEFKDGESATQIRALPEDNYSCRYIVMPMRI